MTRERRWFWLGTGAALLAGLLLRLWFIRHYPRIAGDSLVYGDIAKNLLLHRIYGLTTQGPTPGSIFTGSVFIRPTLIRLPGFPLFMATCFRLLGMEHYRAILYVQVAADLITCWLCAALAGRLFGRRAFLPVLWLAALCPFTSTYVALPLTEILVLTTIALAFYCFARWQQAGAGYNRWLWIIAATLSYSILLRPDQGLLTAAVVPAMLWVSRKSHRYAWPRAGAPVLAACLCVLLPFIPWTARNWHTFHVFQPLAPRSAADPGDPVANGFNRWYRTWAVEYTSTPEIYWNYDGNAIDLATLPNRAFALGCRAQSGVPRESQPLYARTSALFNDYNQQTAASPAFDARFDELAQERIAASPICYYALLPVARLLDMIFRPRVETIPIPLRWWAPPTHPGQTAFCAAYAALNFTYFVLALAGLRAWQRGGWNGFGALAFAMAASLILRSALLLTLDNSEARYTLEFFPVLFVWAGALFASRSESMP